MRFSVLGPLEVHNGDTPVSIGGGQQRKLLAVLLVHANEPVRTATLIEALWGGRPPDTAGKALQGYVSQLRKRVGADTLETVRGGYRFRVSAADLDAARFEELLAHARRLDREPAAAHLRDALALWRGEPYAEFTYDEFAQAEIGRLEELRLSCLERRIELDLALGRDDDVVPELEALVRAHPLRERFRRQLILGLYRSGRQADALEAYADARRTLRDELGLDPGEELQSLQRAVLAHDPSLAPPPRVEPATPRPTMARQHRGPRVAAAAGVALLAAAATVSFLLVRGGSRPRSVIVPVDSVAVIDSRHDAVVGFAPVGRSPVALASGAGGVWVANADDGTVDRLDPETGRVVATIGIGADVSDVATGFDSVWVADGNDGTITQVDPAQDGIERTISPSGAAGILTLPIFFVATDDRYVWAIQGAKLLRIDPRTGLVTKNVAIGGAPTALATGGGFVWITTVDDRIVRVDAHTLTVSTGPRLAAPAYSAVYSDGAFWILVPSPNSGTLERLDPQTLAASPFGLDLQAPTVVAVRGEALWIADFSGNVERIELATGRTRARLSVGHPVAAIVVGARRLWLAVSSPT
jgi:DNA-binding SARP family transcriptional activator/streptogramin lyase